MPLEVEMVVHVSDQLNALIHIPTSGLSVRRWQSVAEVLELPRAMDFFMLLVATMLQLATLLQVDLIVLKG